MKSLNLRANRRRLAAISLTALVFSGCTLRYTDSRSGAEHLWGMGELRVKTDLVEPGELVAVTTGSRVPGLCVDIGRDNFGLSFGWLVRQRTVVAETNELATVEGPRTHPAWQFNPRNDNDRVWAVGHLKMKGAPLAKRHHAVITGRALAGLGAHAGTDDTALTAGIHARQHLAITHDDTRLDFAQDAPRWPGFDLFVLKVSTGELEESVDESSTPQAENHTP